jgi:hypothetical protein
MAAFSIDLLLSLAAYALAIAVLALLAQGIVGFAHLASSEILTSHVASTDCSSSRAFSNGILVVGRFEWLNHSCVRGGEFS